MNKQAYSISDQIALLKQRSMTLRDEMQAYNRLKNISYYRLKGYWWDTQIDDVLHTFYPGVCFEDIMERYDFDRQLRQILFSGIEQIEIAVRSKMTYYLSITYGGFWYLNSALFDDAIHCYDAESMTAHAKALEDLQKEFERSQEIFISEHKRLHPGEPVEAWKMMEVASMGTISKLYKNLKITLPERSIISKEMGVNSTTLVVERSRNINNRLNQSDDMKQKIINLIDAYSNVPIYKYGFYSHWRSEPLWKN
jgi:abortive infection bacteriophage resistance protein